MSKQLKVNVTKDYALFHQSDRNRNVDEPTHRGLHDSMKKYGFLKCLPIVVYRDKRGRLIVKDGQHRLHFARLLELPVYWIEADQDYDVAEVARTPKPWKPRDFATMHATNGLAAYQIGLDFADDHKIPVGLAFALLAGTTTFHNVVEAFAAGEFAVKDQRWADAVVSIYGAVGKMNAKLRNARFLQACMAVCRVAGFDRKRLIAGIERQRESLIHYATCEAYLDMLEEAYNFGRAKVNWIGLKLEAQKAMFARHARSKRAEGEEVAA